MSGASEWQLLYRAGSRLARVRLLFWVAVPFALWTMAYASELADNPADDAWAVVLALFGIAVAAGMYVYLRLYVSEIAFDEKRRMLRLQTVTPSGTTTRDVPSSHVVSVKSFDGELVTDRHHVVAPWLAVRLADRTLPLIVDMQNTIGDKRVLLRALSGHPGA